MFAQKQGPGGQRGHSHGNEGVPASKGRNPPAYAHSAVGNQALLRLLRQGEAARTQSRGLKGNLEVRPASDAFEVEADRAADQVLRMSAPPEAALPVAGSGEAERQGSGRNVLAGTGQPLSKALRAHYEPRFGHDFSGVRVHDDAQAAHSAKALRASAYTAGQDIVFGEGQFAPEQPAGQRLLAHELAHVVQQGRGQVGASIQRRLLIEGDAKDADLALHILETGSGLTLRRDKKTGEVTVKAQSPHPHSPALETELLTIINNPTQDAEINVMQRKDPPGYSIEFGAFPEDASDYDAGEGVRLVQQVRIDEIAALEKGVPGAGAYTLSHEIWENYSAHSPAELGSDKKLKGHEREALHNRMHPLAEAQANLVAGELIGPGERKAMFQVSIEVGKPPKLILRHVEDMGQYFLVWDQTFASDARLNVHKANRVRVSQYTMQGPDPGIIAKIVDDLKKHPTASARFEGASSNVVIVEEIIFQTADQSDVVSHYRFFEDGNGTNSKDSVVVTIERPNK